MDKCKALWLAFLHWQGWKKLAGWPGWTGWLKWKIWRTIGKWSGWKKLLYPHPVIIILLTALSGGGLTWVFLAGNERSVTAYLMYPVAFYTLVVLVALAVRAVPAVREKNQKKASKRGDRGAFGVGMYVGQFINFIYGGFKIVSGIVAGSAWLGADGIYNFVQGMIQLYQILRHKQVKNMMQQWKSYRQCGFMMILLHLTMTGLVFQMIHMGRHKESSEIMIIATAAFTFFKLTKAILDVAKDRKHKNPVDSAVYFLDFSQALYNLFVLQVGLLWVFGGEDFAQQKLMNSLTGGAVCLLVCGLGLYMLWRSKRDMRKLEEKESA